MEVLWTLGGAYDGRYPWNPAHRYRPDIGRLAEVAAAIDRLPFSGALLAIGVPGTYDPWTVAASVASITSRMRWLIAVYPGIITPTQLALMSLSLDHLSGGRLMLNVVGSNPVTMAAHGVHLEKADRYAMLDAYWQAVKALYAGIEGPESRFFPIQNPRPLRAGVQAALRGMRVPGEPLLPDRAPRPLPRPRAGAGPPPAAVGGVRLAGGPQPRPVARRHLSGARRHPAGARRAHRRGQ